MVWDDISFNTRYSSRCYSWVKKCCPIYRKYSCESCHVVPTGTIIGLRFTFQHYNTRPQVAVQTSQSLEKHQIPILWTGQLLSHNPIDDFWDELYRKLRNWPVASETIKQLLPALLEDWVNIPQENIQRIIESMPRRCQAITQSRRGHTCISFSLTFILHLLVLFEYFVSRNVQIGLTIW